MNKTIAFTLLLSSVLFHQSCFSANIGIGKQLNPARLDAIAMLDKNGDSKLIEPGIESEALVLYINDEILGEFDENNDRKITGKEAQNLANKTIGDKISESELDRVYSTAYEVAKLRMTGGVSPTDTSKIKQSIILVPRTKGFSFGLGYGDKDEVGSETESIYGSLEYTWKANTFFDRVITYSSSLSYAKQNVFVGNDVSKVERWNAQPLKITIDSAAFDFSPFIGLGYGRSRSEILSNNILNNENDNEFTLEFGLNHPFKVPTGPLQGKTIVTLTVSQQIRFDDFLSGKRNDEFGIGIKIGVNEFKTIRNLLMN